MSQITAPHAPSQQTTALALAKPADRAIQRERERRARERRLAKLEVMRQKLDALEYATLVTSTLGDTDAVWDDFIDRKTMRVRQSLRLAKEAAALEREHAQLQRLLEEHKLASRVLEELVKPPPKDAWELKVEQFRAAGRWHFQPWTMEECQNEIEAA